jgi:hypothetical protein
MQYLFRNEEPLLICMNGLHAIVIITSHHRVNFDETGESHAQQLMLFSQGGLQGRCARHNYRVIQITFHLKQSCLWNTKSMSKVPNGPPPEVGDQFDSFANFIVVPFFVSHTFLFLGT